MQLPSSGWRPILAILPAWPSDQRGTHAFLSRVRSGANDHRLDALGDQLQHARDQAAVAQAETEVLTGRLQYAQEQAGVRAAELQRAWDKIATLQQAAEVRLVEAVEAAVRAAGIEPARRTAHAIVGGSVHNGIWKRPQWELQAC